MNNALLASLLAVAGGYLLGSVSFAILASRLFGLADPRSYGSGNPGATNVLRSGSRAAALFTLLGDTLKGTVAVVLVRAYGERWGVGEVAVAATGAAAFVGHLFPVYFGFKGGKGVATFLGVMLALDLAVGLGCCLVWLAVALALRYSSLASMCAALAAPVLWFAIGPAGPAVLLPVAMAGLLLWRHAANIANLRAGRERRIGQRERRTAPAAGSAPDN